MGQQPIEIPVNLGMKGIKAQLKELQGQIANTFDPEEIARLSAKAGELKDNLARVNEQVAIYSSGSPFEQSANALGLVVGQLGSLDFEGAAESATLLQERIASITPAQVTKQMKGLTDTFSILGKVSGQAIISIIKNIGAMAKAFISFGVQLLANPIFLLAIAIVLIVTAIVALLSKLGLLKPIMEAIGKVFEWIGWVIDKIVEGFNMLTDWLGFTNIAAEESARKQTEAAEKKADAYEQSSKRIIGSLDQEIRIMKINGQDTMKQELQKQAYIKESARLRYKALIAKMEENKLTEEMDEEELKALREKIAAQRELIQGARNETAAIIAQAKADDKKEADAAAKEAKAQAKEAAANAKQYAQDRINAARQARDLELSILADGVEKELAINNEKYKRQIEDTRRNEKLLAGEKERIIASLKEEQKKTDQKIQDDDFKERQEAMKAESAEMAEAMKVAGEWRADQLKRETKAAAELKAMKNASDLEAQKAFLDVQMQQELEVAGLTASEKALIEAKYRDEKAALDAAAKQKALDADKAELQAKKDIGNQALNAAQSLNDLVFLIKDSSLKKGSAAELKAAKTQFNINKGLQMATATISAIQAVQSALAQPSLVPAPLGTILKAANVVAAGAAGVGNVAKIASAKFEGGSASASTSGGGASAGGSASVAGASPSTNLFGSANQINNLSASNSAEATNSNTQNITVTAVVAADQMSAEQMVNEKIIKASKM